MDQKILREYLIALGFRIDQGGEKKVDGLLTGMDKKASRLGKSLIGVGIAAITATTVFARQMEKMYYASRFADTTVGNMQALEYGTRNIGLEAGKGASALKNMASAIRSNPGLIGLLNSLGIQVQGRDKADVLVDLVGALKKMPFYVAERYANLFGIDQETLFHLQEGLDKMKEATAERKRMAAEMGVDPDAISAASREYAEHWRRITEYAGLFAGKLATMALPAMTDLAEETVWFLRASNEALTYWERIGKAMKNAKPGEVNDPKRIAREGLTGIAEGERVTLTDEAKQRLGMPKEELPAPAKDAKGVGLVRLYNRWQFWRDSRGQKKYQPRVATDPEAVDAAQAEIPRRKVEAPQPEISPREGGTPRPDREDGQDGKPRMTQGPGRRERTPRTAPGNDQDDRQGVLRDPEGEDDAYDPRERLERLEKEHNLPKGLLDTTWRKESQRGNPKYMRSPAGAKGHFGFMDRTAKEYGLKDPDDFDESADAAARKWADLMKRYKGDLKMAAAAYNWGDGNLAKFGLARAPKETREYVEDVSQSVKVEANPTINVYGVNSPQEAAKQVVDQQKTVNADIVRNMSPKVR